MAVKKINRLNEKEYREYVRLIKAIEGKGRYTKTSLQRCERLLAKASLEQILKAHEEG